MLPGSHLLPLELPDVVNPLLIAFLRGNWIGRCRLAMVTCRIRVDLCLLGWKVPWAYV